MTVFVVWSDHPLPSALDGVFDGPWREVRRVADHLVLVDSVDGLSRVFHAVKWELPDDAALLVTPTADVPKLRYLPSGTLTWLRRRAGASLDATGDAPGDAAADGPGPLSQLTEQTEQTEEER